MFIYPCQEKTHKLAIINMSLPKAGGAGKHLLKIKGDSG